MVRGGPTLLGRDRLLTEVDELLGREQNVILFGPAGIGKTTLIKALPPRDLVVIDPFERVSSHLAARIRRSIGRGTLHIVATRSLDRRELGAVRRIAFWFTVVAVPPLPPHLIERLVRREWQAAQLPAKVLTTTWLRAVIRLSAGRPGVALAVAQAAADRFAARGVLPSPPATYIEARLSAFAGGNRLDRPQMQE